MAKKKMDEVIKDKMPNEYIVNIHKTDSNMTVSCSSMANANKPFDISVSVNGDQVEGGKALELLSTIVSESL